MRALKRFVTRLVGLVMARLDEERKGVLRQIRVHVVDVRKSGLWVQSERAIAGGTLVNLYTADLRDSDDPSEFWRLYSPRFRRVLTQ